MAGRYNGIVVGLLSFCKYWNGYFYAANGAWKGKIGNIRCANFKKFKILWHLHTN
jgi:hypothetical protein